MFPRRSRTLFAAFLAISVTLLLGGLLALLLPSGATQAQTQPEALGSLRGVVRNSAGDPLPNISVTLGQYRVTGEFRYATSNSAGVYEFPSLASGTYTLQFSDPNKQYATRYYVAADFSSDAATVIVNGNDVDNVNVELAPAGAISLTVQSSSPVSMTLFAPRLYRQTQRGAWLIYREFYAESNTRDFLFDSLPAGSYRLCVTISDQTTFRYATECYENAVPTTEGQLAPNASDIAVQAGQERRIVIDFDDAAQIQGTVLSPDGAPLGGIFIVLLDESGYNQTGVTSDGNGRFHFPPVPQGNYRLVYNTPFDPPNGYLPLYYPNAGSIAHAETIEVTADTHISVTARLRRAAQITGKVTLPGDAPVSYVDFSIFRQWRDGTYNQFYECLYGCIPSESYDNRTGVYTITNLIDGNYRIGVYYYLANTQSFQFQFYGGTTLEEADTISLAEGGTARNIDFVVGEGQFDGAIAGRVTADGRPVAGMEVGLFLPNTYFEGRGAMPQFSTLTNADGRYSLEGLAAGYYIVGVRDPNHNYATTFYNQAPTDQDIYPVPVPGETLWHSGTGTLNNVDLALSPGATIRGHVRAQNMTRGDFTVIAAPLNSYYSDPYYSYPVAYSDVRTDATGYYEITGLMSGTYYLRAHEPVGTGEPLGAPILYPGTFDGSATQPVTVTTGQTLDAQDFWYYPTPNNFLPIIDNGPAPDNGTNGNDGEEPPALTPVPALPVPLPTPTPTPMVE